MSVSRTLMLPEGFEGAWLDGDDVSVLMPRHTRTVDLAGEQVEVTVPRLLLTFGEKGAQLFMASGQAYRAVSNVWDDGRICYGENPTPQDPWEAWNFFWSGQFNTDLNSYGYHAPGSCQSSSCAEHGSAENCPARHVCRGSRGCRCDPPSCECVVEHEHAHGYKTTSCDCCEGRCDHGVETCTCDASTWSCPCESGDCSCASEEPCTPADDDTCLCGQLENWREKVKQARPGDYDGPAAPASAFVFPAGAVGWRPDTGEVVARDGSVVVKVPGLDLAGEGHKYKVGDRVRLLPLISGQPTPPWWGSYHADYQCDLFNVRRLLPGRRYQLDFQRLEVPEDYLEGEHENWSFRLGERAVPLVGPQAGRALRVMSTSMAVDRSRSYVLESLPGTVAQQELRAATEQDPIGPKTVLFKYKAGNWVAFNQSAAGVRDSWRHQVGALFKVSETCVVNSEATYYLSGHPNRVPERCLDQATEPPTYGIVPGSQVRVLPRPVPTPLWWTTTLGVGHTFLAQPGNQSQDGARSYVDPNTGVHVREQCLEVVSGPSPVSEGPVVYRPTCGYKSCRLLECNRVTYLNPNYPAPPYSPQRDRVYVGAVVKVLNVVGTTEAVRVAVVGQTHTVEKVDSDGLTMYLRGVPWCFNSEDLEVIS